MRHPARFLVLAILLAGCTLVPPALRGGELIVLEVANRSAQPITLVVAAPGSIDDIVGAVDPTIVPPGRTIDASFYVPHDEQWAIFAAGGELMGSVDVGGKRGRLPMGITVEADGNMSWWCEQDCP